MKQRTDPATWLVAILFFLSIAAAMFLPTL